MRTRNNISRVRLALLFLLAVASAIAHAERPPQQQQQQQQQQQSPTVKATQATPHVDLVIALDTSSSMDGLIDSARAKLWDIVNLLARAKPRPVLRIGLLSYGNDGYDSSAGWVRKESDLTTDLDAVYAKLFALRTNGGTEYVARAVHAAVNQMSWDGSQETLRIVFVAGNEPADQDPDIKLPDAAKEADRHRVRVNTIYCGSEGNHEKVGWQALASLARGGYNSIDQTEVAAIPTPMDAELARLSAELNETYIAYGKDAAEKKANQVAQDANAGKMGAASAATRAQAKASSMYRAGDWDLVDAQKESGGAALAKMPAAALPAEVAALPPEKREAYVAAKAKKREEIQKRITEISTKRDAFVRDERTRRAKAGKTSLDDAMNATIQKQAEESLNVAF